MGVFDHFKHDSIESQTKTAILLSGPWLHTWRVVEGALQFESYCNHCDKLAVLPCPLNCSFVVISDTKPGYRYFRYIFEGGKLTKHEELPEDLGDLMYDGYEGVLGIQQPDGTYARYWTPICPHCGQDIAGKKEEETS